MSTSSNLPSGRRVLVIGWDAADWLIVDQLLAQGRMPVLERLIQRGVRSDLTTLEPKLSPLLWVSVATARTPDVHGILNFVEPKPDGSGLRIASSTSRKVKAIWNIATQAGLRVQCTGWYASHPAEPVRGIVTSNMLMEGDPGQASAPWPLVPGAVHPPDLSDTLAQQRVGRATFARTHLAQLFPYLAAHTHDARVDTLCKLMATAMSVERVALASMRAQAWDLAMVFFETIDTMGHHFMQYRPPRMAGVAERDVRAFGAVMDSVYCWHDAALGRLLEQAGPDTTVFILSDHGFQSGGERPSLEDLPPEMRMEKEASWHRPLGLWVASGPGVKAGGQPIVANVLDLTPTALTVLGLPCGVDFDGRVLAEILEDPAPAPVESWEAPGADAGLHPEDLRQDPFEAADAIQQLVDLGYMAALPEDAQAQIDLVKRESTFNLGVHLLSRNKFRAALPQFEALHALRPDEARYAVCRASCCAALGDHAQAVQILREAVSQRSGDLELRVSLAMSLSEIGLQAEAQAEADRVLAAQHLPASILVRLSECLLRQGRLTEALNAATAARAADQHGVGAMLALARAHLCAARYEAAAECALDAMEASKALPDGHWLLGTALAWYGDLDNAAKSLAIGLQFDPQHVPSLRMATILALARGEAAAATLFQQRAHAALERTDWRPPSELPFEAEGLRKHLGLAPA